MTTNTCSFQKGDAVRFARRPEFGPYRVRYASASGKMIHIESAHGGKLGSYRATSLIASEPTEIETISVILGYNAFSHRMSYGTAEHPIPEGFFTAGWVEPS